ncbi:MAG: hypothetical protein Q9223_004574 [Gallowayella weberi]
MAKPLCQRSLIRILFDSWHSSYQSITTIFAAPNPTYTVLLIFLINGLAVRVEVLLPQYTSLALHWPLSTVNLALTLQSLVSAFVLLALPTLRERYLEPHMSTASIDLLIIRICLLAGTFGMIGLGFSAPAAFLVVALCIYTCKAGLYDSLTAYGTLTLPPLEKVSELYVRIGLITEIAALVGAPLWSTFFSLVLQRGGLPLGLPFWVSASLYATGVGCAVALKRWLVFAGDP